MLYGVYASFYGGPKSGTTQGVTGDGLAVGMGFVDQCSSLFWRIGTCGSVLGLSPEAGVKEFDEIGANPNHFSDHGSNFAWAVGDALWQVGIGRSGLVVP